MATPPLVSIGQRKQRPNTQAKVAAPRLWMRDDEPLGYAAVLLTRTWRSERLERPRWELLPANATLIAQGYRRKFCGK